MKKSFVTMAAAAVFFSTAGAAVQAEEVTVQKGDTLWKLAGEYDVSVEQIKDWNSLSSDKIVVNQVLDIHREKAYTVEKGDTLWSIAKANEVTVEQLKEWNQIKGDIIVLGQKIVIFPGSTASAANEGGSTVKTAASKPVKTASEGAVKEISVEATAYTASCNGCSGTTATGINLKQNPNQKVIAVDPSVIPLGSRVFVEGYGEAIAGDTGGAIKGNKIDVFMPEKQDALNWGRKTVNVKILD
ncbi:LysM peptidoglycan-binding and 3D domain-containing protein [Cytobacillus gottheilii]|uniref:LysM peptidoglycan-binding and 3D domain-containing protein n=1 Tax=Cytobacillus gottheilii TaxID=859144 RepID=UPI000830EC28|nr:3D domain-containing protein [Cytobacillus gottheilii]